MVEPATHNSTQRKVTSAANNLQPVYLGAYNNGRLRISSSLVPHSYNPDDLSEKAVLAVKVYNTSKPHSRLASPKEQL